MATKIGLISDPHASVAPVSEALTIFNKNNVDTVYCLGDIAGYGDELTETVNVLRESACKTIMGNHEAWYINKHENTDDPILHYFNSLPRVIEIQLEEKSLYFVHACPPDDDMNGIRLLNENGNIIESEKYNWEQRLEEYTFDILVVGHTHQVFHENIGNKLVINPGSTKFNHTCMILSLPDMNAEIIPLSNKKPVLSWNWSMMHTRI